MILNTLSGRSFNDLMQYPVFPFILADYSSPVLDLQSQDSFRYVNLFYAFPIHFAPYHYGSHYSNVAFAFILFCIIFFDIADRIFNSIEDAWRLSSSESTTDFKELTPEFFSLSEFLRNHEKFELGTRQGGEVVGDVKLPDWVPDNDARLFILIHRQALESPIVTQNLHLWIDLVFGFKQTGKNAVEAINVFHPSVCNLSFQTTFGHGNILKHVCLVSLCIDRVGFFLNISVIIFERVFNKHGIFICRKLIELVDELSQSALSTMVRSYGQMPMQVYRLFFFSEVFVLHDVFTLFYQVLRAPHQPHLSMFRKESEIYPAPIETVRGIRYTVYFWSMN
ncbi:unnamed protein product [Angiostrongylus costaricensis]|uniref:BEACH domain-containing protein n=1 Tax=Angiostrongylus costaricensis TaxID=334426 RepID=A0A158PHN5_ANGCS|nr:unnamed protein product [Angiostrongylus costaricensis]